MPHNTRSPQQWEIISQHIDFKDKTVLDLGCGYGDILKMCQGQNADALGVDDNIHLCNGVDILHGDIDKWINVNSIFSWDIIICFSVLPYLKQPFMVLEWIKEHSKQALIECQYSGDGPGFELIKNDNDMQALLSSVGWQSVRVIGKTLVKDRSKYRSIWLCE